MPIWLSIIGLLGSYLVATLAIGLVFRRYEFPFKGVRENLICAMPLGPVALAWVLWVLLRFLPGRDPGLYILFTLLPFLIILACVWRELFALFKGRGNSSNSRPSLGVFKKIAENKPVGFIWLGGGIILVATITQIFGMPMMASDPLEYVSLSEVIYGDLSLENYPLDPSNDQGFYARSAHPPAYHMMIVFSFLWQGAGDSSRLLRFIQLHYLISYILLLVLVARCSSFGRDAKAMSGALAMLLAMGTPFYIALVTAFHIDPMRITLFLTGFVFIARLLVLERKVELRDGEVAGIASPGLFSASVFLSGIAIGLGMFAHSIGLLLLPFCHAAYFFSTKSSFLRRCAVCTVFGLVALSLGAGQYIQNIFDYGVPLHDTEPIWELESVDHKTDVRFRRNLVTLEQRIKNGLLVWFYAPTLYGYIHLIFVASIVLFAKKIWSNIYSRVLIIGLASFYGLAVFSMSLGVDMIIKNIRYMLTIMPFLVVIAAVGGGLIYVKILAFTKRS